MCNFLRWKGTDLDEIWDTVSTLNEGTIAKSLVMSELKPDGWFVMHRCKTSTIKF